MNQEQLKEFAENFENMKRSLDDTFTFGCNQCGKCCINRDDILMTPRDMYNAAKELGMTVIDFAREYCESYIGQNSKMVIVRLLPKGSIKRCPLLKDRKCSVHKAKPTVCAMFPVGRAFRLEAGKKNINDMSVDDIEFIFNGTHCTNTETFTVRQWLEEFGIPIKDQFFVDWHKTIYEVGEVIKIAEKHFKSEDTFDTVCGAIYMQLYLSYDTEKDFDEQFAENKKRLTDNLKLITAFYKKENRNVG